MKICPRYPDLKAEIEALETVDLQPPISARELAYKQQQARKNEVIAGWYKPPAKSRFDIPDMPDFYESLWVGFLRNPKMEVSKTAVTYIFADTIAALIRKNSSFDFLLEPIETQEAIFSATTAELGKVINDSFSGNRFDRPMIEFVCNKTGKEEMFKTFFRDEPENIQDSLSE